jgi:molybdate transport system substrate-binding protein
LPTLKVFSGGAAQALVRALEPDFTAATGLRIEGVFGAVGTMRALLEAGEAADVAILTDAIMRALAGAGLVRPDSLTGLGGVETAIAVRNADRAPIVTDGQGLRAALLACDAIYMPDPRQATAGIHFASVMEGLGIAEEVASRLRTFPNGATAMAALAGAPERRPIGCTQVTEILATPGVMLVMALPPGHDLTTPYTAGILNDAAEPDAARTLLALLAGEQQAGLRARCGFVQDAAGA